MSSAMARESRTAMLERAQLALGNADERFRLRQNHETDTAAVKLFTNSLLASATAAFFDSRGIKEPTSEQKKEIHRDGLLYSDFMQFGHCALWMKDDYSDTFGPAT